MMIYSKGKSKKAAESRVWQGGTFIGLGKPQKSSFFLWPGHYRGGRVGYGPVHYKEKKKLFYIYLYILAQKL